MLIVYSKPTCLYCEKAKSFLKRHKIPFEVVDITHDAAAIESLKAKGLMTVPQIFHGDELAVEGGYEGLLRLGADALKAKIGI